MFGKKKPAEWIEKYKKTNLERYGTENPGILAKTSPRSKKEKLLEDKLKGYQFNIKVGKYRPDYVNQETKHIIEVYGDYWHCNPKIFDPDFYHSQLKKTAKEKWADDAARQSYLESLGYKVTVVWESDLDKYIHENYTN
jgi:G:T-mismatch repair DNA endonuclease (very short patch repair protein)